jgi:hypothetical protein
MHARAIRPSAALVGSGMEAIVLKPVPLPAVSLKLARYVL